MLEAFCFQANGELEGGYNPGHKLISRNGGPIFRGYVTFREGSTFSTGLFGWFKQR